MPFRKVGYLLLVAILTYLGKSERGLKYVHRNCRREQFQGEEADRHLGFAFRDDKKGRRYIWFHQTFTDSPLKLFFLYDIKRTTKQQDVLYTTLSITLKGW